MTYFNDYSLALRPKSKGDVRKNFRPPSCLPVQSRPRPSVGRVASRSNSGAGRVGLRCSYPSPGRHGGGPPAGRFLILRLSDVPQIFTRGYALPHPLTIPIYQSPSPPDSVLPVRFFSCCLPQNSVRHIDNAVREANDHTDQRRTKI